MVGTSNLGSWNGHWQGALNGTTNLEYGLRPPEKNILSWLEFECVPIFEATDSYDSEVLPSGYDIHSLPWKSTTIF